jgi:hypothetical protein
MRKVPKFFETSSDQSVLAKIPRYLSEMPVRRKPLMFAADVTNPLKSRCVYRFSMALGRNTGNL